MIPLFGFAALLPFLVKGIAAVGSAVVGALVGRAASKASLGSRYNDYMNGTTGSSLTTAQQQQNAFTMQQQVAQQQFNAEQAALNRDWQERMSNTAYQRGTADMISAGLNPAMMYGGSAASASTPSGSAASSAAPAGSAPSNVQAGVLSNLMDLAFTAERLRGLDLDNNAKEINNAISQIDLDNHGALVDSVIRLNNQSISTSEAQMKELYQQIKNGQMDNLLKDSQISRNEAETVAAWLSAGWQDRQNEYFDMVRDIRAEAERLQNAKTEEEVREIRASIGLIALQQMTEKERANLLSEEARQAFENTRNLRQTNKILKAEATTAEVAAQYAKAGQIVGLISQGAGAIRDAGIGIGSVLSRGMFSGLGSRSGSSVSPTFGRNHSYGTIWDAE